MNKLLVFFVCTLLISSTSAGLLDFILTLEPDKGEQFFEGSWNETIRNDKGQTTDLGEFTAWVWESEQGEYTVDGHYQRNLSHYDDKGKIRISYDTVNDKGEFSFVNIRNPSLVGKPFTEEEIVPPTIKKLRFIL